MARKLRTDRVLFIVTFLLVCTSIVMVYSASEVWSGAQKNHDVYFVATRQALWAALGVALLSIVMRIDYHTYRTDSFVWFGVGLVALLLVMVFLVGPKVNGSRRWLSFAGLTLQPSELAKLTCVMFTALILERRMHRIDEIGYSLLPIAIVVGSASLLILVEPDMGTAGSLLLIAGVMVFVAGLHYRYVIGTLLAMVPVGGLLVILAAYREERWLAFLDPWSYAQGAGYQPIQSMAAVATGGVFGLGLNHGVQKMFYLPYPHNDFIYAVIGEELGLLGAVAVLICFMVIAWRGLRIAMRAQDAFGSFVAIGITTMICAQALVNMSVVLSLLPTKGIPLPLVSAGGSSLVASLVGIGVLLNISQHDVAEA